MNKAKCCGYQESQILALNETKTYLANMWDSSYGAGLFFSALHELGEHMFIPLKIDGKNFYACHGIFDGLSAYEYVNKKFKLGLNLKSAKKNLPKNSLLTLVKAFFSALFSKPLQEHRYPSDPQPYSSASHAHFFHLSFEEEKGAEQSTAYFLNVFARYCMKKFSTNNISRWQFSVNVRGEVAASQKGQVFASFLSIDCEESDTIESTKLKLTRKLKSKEYLGFWYLSRFLRFLGPKILTYLTKKELAKKETSWFGLFTNLGDIGGNGTHEVLLFPTVRWHRPIAGLIFKHNKKIYLTVALHQRLAISNEDLGKIQDELRSQFI